MSVEDLVEPVLLRCRGDAGRNSASATGASLGEQIRLLRVSAGLTQRELAVGTGSTQPAIARLETGQSTPTLATMEKLAQALGQDIVLLVPHRVEGEPR